MSSRRSRRPGRRNVQRLMRASRSSRKRPAAHRRAEVAVRAGDQLEVARHFAVAAERQEALLLERPQQHRLLVGAELADLVEEQQAAVAPRAAGPAGRACAPVNAPLTWPNSADIAASPRSVAQLTSTNGPATCAACSLQLVDAPREQRLAGAGRPESAGSAPPSATATCSIRVDRAR